jgi:hypothetical protein
MPGLETKCKHTINGALQYASTFTCLLMASIWYKILVAIDNVNMTIQSRDSTIDVEVDNIDGLTTHLKSLRDKWGQIYNEVEVVAKAMGTSAHHRLVGIRRGMGEITPDTYRVNVFYRALDSVLAGLSTRYRAIYAINSTFKFL